MTAYLDIEVPRNGDYLRESQLVDVDDNPIDITNSTFVMSVRSAAGASGSVLASFTVTKLEPYAEGRFTEKLSGSALSAVAGAMEVVRLAYDIKRTDAGIVTIEREGAVLLKPGVS
jgi:hypothetical protein